MSVCVCVYACVRAVYALNISYILLYFIIYVYIPLLSEFIAHSHVYNKS